MTADDTPTAPVDLPIPDPARPTGTATSPAAAPTAPPPPPVGAATPARPAPDAATYAPAHPTPGAASSALRPARAADAGNTPAIVFGILLVAGGGLLLVTRLVDVTLGGAAWPLWLIVPGIALLIASFAVPPRGGLGLAIPGAMLAMVGLVLWVQATYDAYATWAYAWALVAPTAPGIGMLAYGAVRGDGELARDGVRTTLVGIGLFIGFALFFEGVVGLSGRPIAGFEDVLPYAAVGLGALLVVASVVGGGRRSPTAR